MRQILNPLSHLETPTSICWYIFATETVRPLVENIYYLFLYRKQCSDVKGGNHVAKGETEAQKLEISFPRLRVSEGLLICQTTRTSLMLYRKYRNQTDEEALSSIEGHLRNWPWQRNLHPAFWSRQALEVFNCPCKKKKKKKKKKEKNHFSLQKPWVWDFELSDYITTKPHFDLIPSGGIYWHIQNLVAEASAHPERQKAGFQGLKGRWREMASGDRVSFWGDGTFWN